MSGFTRVTWRKEEKPEPDVVDRHADAVVAQAVERAAEREVVLDRLVLGQLDHERAPVVGGQQLQQLVAGQQGGGGVEREVEPLGQAVVGLEREPHGGQLELRAELERVGVEEAVDSVGIAIAVGVGEARERLGAHDLAAGEVDDRLQRDVHALAADQPPDPPGELLAARAVGARELLLARGPLALGGEVGADLVLELAQLVREADEAHHQADGRDRELAGAQREARPPGVGVRLRGEDVGEPVAGRQRQRGDHAHRAPGGRAVVLRATTR